MVDWLRFDVTDEFLYVHILVGKLVELQPATTEGTDEFCNELYPVLDKIQDICIEKNITQICKADISNVDVTKIRPISLLKIIWNVYEYTKNNIMLSECNVSGSSPFFVTLFEATRGFLPPFMRKIVSISV